MKTQFYFLICIFVFGCNHPESNEFNRDKQPTNRERNRIALEDGIDIKDNTFKVIGIKDGDTIDLLVDGVTQTVRLANIDAPEKKQPFGKKAKQLLANLCFGKNVTLLHNSKYDRYKRLIAEIITESGININKEMVSNGLAWHYKKYSSDTSYSRLETIAKENKFGLWADKNPIPPWEWRKLSKQHKLEILEGE